MTKKEIEQFLKMHPFMTHLTYGGNNYLCIVQNKNNTLTHIYDFGEIHDKEDQKKFLQLGDEWWWQSNRKIPINIFFRSEWNPFRFTRKSFNSRDVKIISGPVVSLSEINQRRTKRKSITLIKKP